MDIEVERAKWWTERAEEEARNRPKEPPASGILVESDLPRHLAVERVRPQEP